MILCRMHVKAAENYHYAATERSKCQTPSQAVHEPPQLTHLLAAVSQ